MVDVEADGPIPGENEYSMLSIGAVVVKPGLKDRFYSVLRPISDNWDKRAMEVCGFEREEALEFPAPKIVMQRFYDWLIAKGGNRPMFISDNNGFDWLFINWYFWHFLGTNPFGWSSTNLGSLYKGMVKDTFKNFKHLRSTKHSHNALDDALGNAEALLAMKERMNLKISLK
jgi:hypothetical protein